MFKKDQSPVLVAHVSVCNILKCNT